MGKYDHIINMAHHEPVTRPRMAAANRAAQFAPFAALTGYEDAVDETARLTDRKQELSDKEIDALNRTLGKIKAGLEAYGETGNGTFDDTCSETFDKSCHESRPRLRVSYFVPDDKKEGGTYEETEGTVKRIDTVYKMLVFTDGRMVSIPDIREIVLEG